MADGHDAGKTGGTSMRSGTRSDRSRESIWPRVGRGITRLRNFVLNAVFVVFLLIFLAVLFLDVTPSVPDDGALVLDPRGVLVDQRSPMDACSIH